MKEETKLTKDNLLSMLRESLDNKENSLYDSMFAYNNEPTSLGGLIDKIKESESENFLIKTKTKNKKKLTVITDL
jgi:hypothetical protein